MPPFRPLPSPPFRPSVVVAGASLVIYPLKTRHYDVSHNQPFHHKQSAAVTLQTTSTATNSTAIALQTTSTTTSLQPSRYRQTLPQPVYSIALQTTSTTTSLQHRAADDPYYDQCTAGTADAPQTQTQTQTTTTIPQLLDNLYSLKAWVTCTSHVHGAHTL